MVVQYMARRKPYMDRREIRRHYEVFKGKHPANYLFKGDWEEDETEDA